MTDFGPCVESGELVLFNPNGQFYPEELADRLSELSGITFVWS